MGLLTGAGKTLTIIRAGGNKTVILYIKAKLKAAALYAREFLAEYEDDGLQEGDLLQDGSDYYLVPALQKIDVDVSQAIFKGFLYKCNSVVTVRQYNSGTKEYEDLTTDVNCLITDTLFSGDEDRNTIMRRGTYRGRDIYYFLYIQSVSGFTKKTPVVDAMGRQFKVIDEMNPFFASGIIEARLKWTDA